MRPKKGHSSGGGIVIVTDGPAYGVKLRPGEVDTRSFLIQMNLGKWANAFRSCEAEKQNKTKRETNEQTWNIVNVEIDLDLWPLLSKRKSLHHISYSSC